MKKLLLTILLTLSISNAYAKQCDFRTVYAWGQTDRVLNNGFDRLENGIALRHISVLPYEVVLEQNWPLYAGSFCAVYSELKYAFFEEQKQVQRIFQNMEDFMNGYITNNPPIRKIFDDYISTIKSHKELRSFFDDEYFKQSHPWINDLYFCNTPFNYRELSVQDKNEIIGELYRIVRLGSANSEMVKHSKNLRRWFNNIKKQLDESADCD